jgi:hypothetical protein
MLGTRIRQFVNQFEKNASSNERSSFLTKNSRTKTIIWVRLTTYSTDISKDNVGSLACNSCGFIRFLVSPYQGYLPPCCYPWTVLRTWPIVDSRVFSRFQLGSPITEPIQRTSSDEMYQAVATIAEVSFLVLWKFVIMASMVLFIAIAVF